MRCSETKSMNSFSTRSLGQRGANLTSSYLHIFTALTRPRIKWQNLFWKASPLTARNDRKREISNIEAENHYTIMLV